MPIIIMESLMTRIMITSSKACLFGQAVLDLMVVDNIMR
jgi:hypothetical protein